jgi:hypothetical protein
MTDLLYDEHFEQLAAGYFDEVLDAAQQAELKALLQADDRRVKRFAELAQLDQMINAEIAYQHEANRFGLSRSPNDSASASALAELASLYEDGLQSPVNFTTWRREQADKAAAERRQFWLTRTLIGSAVAAALLLAATLLAVVLIGDAPEPQVADQQDDKQDAINPTNPVIPTDAVATLTNTHNALWAERALARGSELTPNQRLTLTAGFAEITTKRGAIAILEAPATIELLDNDNALHLHAGKLVGICETDSSKGFLVRTPHMDIIDIGTRFGVDVSGDDVTASVFSGEVRLSRLNTPEQSLSAGQTARLAAVQDTFEFNVEEQLADSFDTLLASSLVAAPASLDRWRPRFEGDNVIWGGAAPADLRSQKQVSDKLQVFCEQQGLEIKPGLAVNLTPQVPTSEDGPKRLKLPGGQRVDVYLLHMDTPGAAESLDEYVIHFDRPIVGVITSGQMLTETDSLLGAAGVNYASDGVINLTNRGQDQATRPILDQAAIEGSSIRITTKVAGYMDQVRVLVQSLPEVSE